MDQELGSAAFKTVEPGGSRSEDVLYGGINCLMEAPCYIQPPPTLKQAYVISITKQYIIIFYAAISRPFYYE